MKNFIKEYTYEVNHSAHDWSNTMSTLISSRQNLQQVGHELYRRCARIAQVRRVAIEEARSHYKLYLERRGADYDRTVKDRYGVTRYQRLEDLGRVRRSMLRKAKELIVQREALSANSRSLVAVEEKLRKCKRSC